MALRRRFTPDTFRRYFNRDSPGLHYAVRIFIGTVFLWALLHRFGDHHATWAIISLIVVTESRFRAAFDTFRYRIYNTIAGCATGLAFLLVFGPEHWVLPLVVASSVLIATRLPQSPTSWRIAPITSILVLSSSFLSPSRLFGLQVALQRAGEVFLGGATALLITWLMSLVWMPREDRETPEETPV